MTLRRSPMPPRRARLARGPKPLDRWTRIKPLNAEKKARRKKRYTAYLASAAWTRMKKEIHARAHDQCEMLLRDGSRCPETDRLQVHHKTYARFGAELPTDLTLVCRGHHEAIHAAQGKRGDA